jgi:hypothetical protein
MQNVFGSGFLYGVPTADATGAAIANPSPVQFGILQDVSVDFSFDNKQLHGQNQFPVAVGRGKGKITLKTKFAQIHGALFNSVFFGGSLTSGIVAVRNDTTGATIPATPHQITPAVPASGTYARDLGVIDDQGRPMIRVASAPATGQYSVDTATGVYTFAAADAAKLVFINFEYTAASAVAKQSTVKNQPMGYAPTFIAVLSQPFNGKTLHCRFNKCIASKLAMASKNDDFTIPELDFDAFADESGNVMTYGLSE